MPLIRGSVEKLGFKFTDVKVLLMAISHADHCAGSAEIKSQPAGASYMVMEGDVRRRWKAAGLEKAPITCKLPPAEAIASSRTAMR